MNKTYTVDYFIDKFEAIPEGLWVESYMHKDGKSCALGHCGCKEYSDADRNEEAIALSDLLRIKFPEEDHNFWLVSLLNDGNLGYNQDTPKQRILAALYDIKKLSEPIPEVKEKIRYIKVPDSLTEQTRVEILKAELVS